MGEPSVLAGLRGTTRCERGSMESNACCKETLNLHLRSQEQETFWASLAVVLLVLVHAIRTRHDVSAGSRTTVPCHNTHNSAGEPMVQLAEVICTTGEPR